MGDVGQVAEAIAVIGKLVWSSLHPTQQAQITEAYEDSQKRVDLYKTALLADDSDTCTRLELGIVQGIPASFGPNEIKQLESKPSEGFNKFNQLGWFQRAEGARFASKVIEIIRTNSDTSSS